MRNPQPRVDQVNPIDYSIVDFLDYTVTNKLFTSMQLHKLFGMRKNTYNSFSDKTC